MRKKTGHVFPANTSHSSANDSDNPSPRRRDFLRKSVVHGAAACALLSPVGRTMANAATDVDSRRLRLVNVHTREKISIVYWQDGSYVDSALHKINFLLRDFRANEVMQMDPLVLDYLHKIYYEMDSREHIQVLSGYRTPQTNEMLRKRSEGVAKNSYHIVGRAVDFRIPGRRTRELQQMALSMGRGGIGYYPKSDFVHIDSGPYRSWE